MKSDIEIAQEAVLWPIQKVAEHLDIPEDDLELYGKYKAKLSDEYLKSIEDRKDFQRTFLPFFYNRQDLVRDPADRAVRNVNIV